MEPLQSPSVLLAREGEVAVLRLNRPEALNAVNADLERDFKAALDTVEADASVRAVVLTGAGRGFCAGADLLEPAPAPVGAHVAHVLHHRYNAIVRRLHALQVPVVSAVNGVAAGGGVGLALSADVVIAAESARFKQVFGPQLGVIPDVGSTWYYPRLLGRGRALPLMLTGDDLPAPQAAAWGLIWQVVPDEQLMPTALGLAQRLAAGPVRAYAAIRAAVDHAVSVPLDAQLDLERDVNGRLCDGPDFAEGVTAFRERRKPRWR
ncbi:enoyl-CoA hydratase-related protein [Ramlibacter sp.]|uniref:enoyl-CoA hydratase-related protein n=1 Tax=Ramlibacter sp. TaxID=1917967 RepID=UPI0035AF0558